MSTIPKDIQYLSQRRRNQLITISSKNESLKKNIDYNNQKQTYYNQKQTNSLQSFVSNTASNTVEEVANMLTKCDTLCKSCFALEHVNE